MKQAEKLLKTPQFAVALEWLKQVRELTLEQQMELAQIPSYSNHESEKAGRFAELVQEAGYETVTIDAVGNVYTKVKGTKGYPRLLVVGHSDTVFPMDTDLKIRHGEDGKIYCPGIADDTRAMAEILSMLRAIKAQGLQPVGDIIFGSDVGEEGPGNMRGVRHLCETLGNELDGFISIDLAGVGTVVYCGTGAKRYRVTFRGSGGHSFLNFGTPNPAYALGRAVADISEILVPAAPRTTFNVGSIGGGSGATAIPKEMEMQIDIRSNGEKEMEWLDKRINVIIQQAVEKENARWPESPHAVTYKIEVLGELPPANQAEDHPIIYAAFEALEQLKIPYVPRAEGAAGSDSNWAIRYGIPAVTLGRGGKSGGGHSISEWFLPEEEYKGPQKDLLTIFSLVGLEGITEPLLETRK